MDVFEITGYKTGVSRENVNFLEPADSFETIENGYIYRQVLQSRQGISLFAPRLADESRIYMITTFIKTDGNTELLAADANFLYKYNVGTRTFDQLSFGGQLAIDGYTGFGLSNPEDYISGTAYPDNLNNSRFVFTSRGMTVSASGSGVFFYDPSDSLVKDFKVDGANGNASYYEEPSASIGNLRRSTHVLYFNERINFVNPQTSVTTYNQGWLYSGIRDSSGKGDKFNTPGSGLGQLDTTETIQGASIYGQYMALNLSGSNWLLEKTRDAFNPYYPKKLPSVIGSDAAFSFAQWNSRIYSMGQNGVLVMDFRESLRTDDKIPFFTRDDIDANTFDYTYGGFDRINAQFLWSYLSDSETYTTQDKVLAYNYEEDSWSVYDIPLTVFGFHEGEETLTWNQIDENIKDSWLRWDTTEEIWNKIDIGDKFKFTLAGDNEGYIYQLNSDYDDKFTVITGISQAAQAVVTIEEHNFQAGDTVVIENVEGMTEINYSTTNTFYTVISATDTTVTINVDSTDFTAYTQNGSLSQPINFLAKTVPFNPYRDKGRSCFVSTIELLINTDGGFVEVDVFANEETAPFIEGVLLQPDPNIQKDRQWVSMVVDHEAEFFEFRFRQNSPSVGVEITSTRIHAEPGGLTHG